MEESPLPLGLPTELGEVFRIAQRLALEAGRILLGRLPGRGSKDAGPEFKGRRELVTEADRESERILVEGLREVFPDHAVLAEEGVASPAGRPDRESEFCWVLDPLDGTTNYVSGHPFFSISMGLLKEGRPHAGLVYLPALVRRRRPALPPGGTLYLGVAGGGAWRDGEPIRVSTTKDLRDSVVATGFAYNRNEPHVNTNLDNFARLLMEVRGLRRCGSASIDLAMTAEGTYDGFWELYLEPYDVAAGIALVLGAGGEVEDLGCGEGPLYGREILATNGRITGEMRALLEGRP